MTRKLTGILYLRNGVVTVAAAALAACETIPNPVTMPNGNYRSSFKHIPHAATAPLRDLNIGIPPVPRQLALLQNPYGTDTLTSCPAILTETRDLEQAMEENFRILHGPEYNRDTRAGNLGEATHELVESTAGSILPYRGIVRYVSGAYLRNKRGQEADRIARQRLGFLIATGRGRNCPGFISPVR